MKILLFIAGFFLWWAETCSSPPQRPLFKQTPDAAPTERGEIVVTCDPNDPLCGL